MLNIFRGRRPGIILHPTVSMVIASPFVSLIDEGRLPRAPQKEETMLGPLPKLYWHQSTVVLLSGWHVASVEIPTEAGVAAL